MQWGGWAKDKSSKWFSDLKLIQKNFFRHGRRKTSKQGSCWETTAVLSVERIGLIFPERSEGLR